MGRERFWTAHSGPLLFTFTCTICFYVRVCVMCVHLFQRVIIVIASPKHKGLWKLVVEVVHSHNHTGQRHKQEHLEQGGD